MDSTRGSNSFCEFMKFAFGSIWVFVCPLRIVKGWRPVVGSARTLLRNEKPLLPLLSRSEHPVARVGLPYLSRGWGNWLGLKLGHVQQKCHRFSSACPVYFPHLICDIQGCFLFQVVVLHAVQIHNAADAFWVFLWKAIILSRSWQVVNKMLSRMCSGTKIILL